MRWADEGYHVKHIGGRLFGGRVYADHFRIFRAPSHPD